MAPEQFDVIAKLLRSRDPVRAAARMVLVDGRSGVEAAAEAGVSPQSANNTVVRFRATDRDIRAAYGLKTTSK